MSLVLGLDLETTGLDTQKDRIIELGYILWDTDLKKAILTYGKLFNIGNTLSAEATRVTKITQDDLINYGEDPKAELFRLLEFIGKYKPKYIVAHNGESYDKPLLHSELRRHDIDASLISPIPWIDTRRDLPFKEEPDSRKLEHLAASHGFLNPHSHRALFDVLTMLKLMSHYELKEIEAYRTIPWVLVRANVSIAEKDLAKKRKFYWDPNKKMWLKEIKANQIAAEEAGGGFLISLVQ